MWLNKEHNEAEVNFWYLEMIVLILTLTILYVTLYFSNTSLPFLISTNILGKMKFYLIFTNVKTEAGEE